MKDLRWESWAAIVAFLICLGYLWVPSPYLMAAFTFIAQPLFLVAMLGYVVKVARSRAEHIGVRGAAAADFLNAPVDPSQGQTVALPDREQDCP
jgi:hypothetical protein